MVATSILTARVNIFVCVSRLAAVSCVFVCVCLHVLVSFIVISNQGTIKTRIICVKPSVKLTPSTTKQVACITNVLKLEKCRFIIMRKISLSKLTH